MQKVIEKGYGYLSATTIDKDLSRSQTVAFNVVDPLDECEDDACVKYQHILTVIDIAARWIELIPLPDTSGKTIAKILD